MKQYIKKEKLILFSILLLVVLTYPFISVANRSSSIFGIPVLYCYLFIVWIVAVIIIGKLADKKPGNNDE